MPKTKKSVETSEAEIIEVDVEFDVEKEMQAEFKRETIAAFATSALPALVAHYRQTGNSKWRELAAKESFEVGNAMYVEFEKQ